MNGEVPEQKELTAEEQAILDGESERFSIQRLQMENQYLSGRVGDLALEKHRLNIKVQELTALLAEQADQVD